MRRKVLGILVVGILLVVAFFAGHASAESPILVQVNDKVVQAVDVAPFEKDGRVMVPIRFVAEALNCKVYWEDETRTVFIYDEEYGRLTLPPCPAPKPGELSGLEQQLVDLVNLERVRLNLKPLAVDMRLVELARMKAHDIIDKGYFAHESPTYGTFANMVTVGGVQFFSIAENLAGIPTVEAAHRALMDSPTHKANIINPMYGHLGIGIVQGSRYGLIICQLFISP